MKYAILALLILLAFGSGFLAGLCIGYDWRNHHDK